MRYGRVEGELVLMLAAGAVLAARFVSCVVTEVLRRC